jgi:hypothetical protein
VVTMVWVVSRFRLNVETSFTRSHKSINNDWIQESDLLAGGDLTTIVSQPTHQLIEYLVLRLLITEREKKNTPPVNRSRRIIILKVMFM